MNRSLFAAALTAVTLFSNVVALGDDATATQLFAEAKSLFDQRLDNSKNDQAIVKLDQAFAQAESDDLKYDILILSSRAYYWQGERKSKDGEKMTSHQAGIDKAKAAQAVNADYADAYYFEGINLGKWALAKGVLASLSRKGELITAAQNAIDRTTKDGEAGETIDGYGPARTLGRLYFKLPSFAGGSREKSLKYLNEAAQKAPGVALNFVYLAETLYDKKEDRELAKKTLDTLIDRADRDPSSFAPDKAPETKYEIEEARQLRKEMGSK